MLAKSESQPDSDLSAAAAGLDRIYSVKFGQSGKIKGQTA